jgi:predicted metal-dependent TIM-barrel fold hydrolase
VLDVLPRYLAKDGVVAVGEVGFDSMTVEEEKAFVRQLELAVEFELPAMVHTPHRDKEQGTRRTLELVADSGLAPGMVVVDHLNEVTVDQVDDAGCWMGFSIYPDTKMDEHRMVAILQRRVELGRGLGRVLVNSAADWGRSDPLKTAKTGAAMLGAGFSEDDVDRVLWRNPVEFFGQSGRLLLGDDGATDGATDATATFEGNSILRGSRD